MGKVKEQLLQEEPDYRIVALHADIQKLNGRQVHARLRETSEAMSGCRAQLSLLLNAAIQYQLNHLSETDGIEVIAQVAALPPIEVLRLLAGEYRPTRETWIKIEKVFMICDASLGHQRAAAAWRLFDELTGLSEVADLLAQRSVELRKDRLGRVDGGSGRRPAAGPWVSVITTAATEEPPKKDTVAKSEADTQPEPAVTPPPIPDLQDHDRKPDPLKANSHKKFMALMRDYRMWAGNPSLREMESRCGKKISYSTFRNLFNSTTVPTKLRTIEILVQVLGGTPEDQQRWATAWRRFVLGEEFDKIGHDRPNLFPADEGKVLRFTGTD